MSKKGAANAAAEMPAVGTIIRPVKRSGVNSRRKQRALVVRDNSGSMAGEKAKHAQAACQEMTDELAAPINRNGFHVGIIDFNDDSRITHTWTPATALVGNIAPLSPAGQTDIAKAIELAVDMVKQPGNAQDDVEFEQPVVFLFSDGMRTSGRDPLEVIDSLRAMATVVTVAFGSDADESLLLSLASSKDHFYRVQSGKELRRFLADAAETMVQAFTQQQNMAVAMTTLQQRG